MGERRNDSDTRYGGDAAGEREGAVDSRGRLEDVGVAEKRERERGKKLQDKRFWRGK